VEVEGDEVVDDVVDEVVDDVVDEVIDDVVDEVVDKVVEVDVRVNDKVLVLEVVEDVGELPAEDVDVLSFGLVGVGVEKRIDMTLNCLSWNI